MPTFIKTGYWEAAVKSYKGWLNLEELISNTVPSQSTIYTADGALTGNRILTLDAKQLVFRTNASSLQNYTYSIGIPAGLPTYSWRSSIIYEGQFLMPDGNAEPYNTRVWGRNQTASSRSLWVNQVFADITAESTGTTNIYNQYFTTRRGSLSDTSTTPVGQMFGVFSTVGHVYSGAYGTTANIVTNDQSAYLCNVTNALGTVVNSYAYKASSQVYNLTSQGINVTNYYAFYSDLFVGYPGYTATSTLTNYYGLFLNTPLVRGVGSITNRWGVYAPDAAMRHHFNGKLLIGTATEGTSKVRIVGLPTSSAGLVSGELWDNGGVINIVP